MGENQELRSGPANAFGLSGAPSSGPDNVHQSDASFAEILGHAGADAVPNAPKCHWEGALPLGAVCSDWRCMSPYVTWLRMFVAMAIRSN